MPPRWTFGRSVCLLFLGVSCLSLYHLWFHPLRVDDAYIGFRMAKNFALGNGLVYNPGERVMTSTTTLYLLLNGILWTLFRDQAVAVILGLNVLWHAATACFLFSFVSHGLGAPPPRAASAYLCAVFAPLFFACSAAVTLIATCGMETPLYTFFICLAFSLYFAGRLNWAIAVSTVPFLIRPEGFLVALTIFASITLTARKLHWRHLGIIAAIVVPYLLALYLYYGTVIPQSIHAKSLIAIDRREVIVEFLKTYFFSVKRLPLGFLFFSGLYYCVAVNRKLLPFIVWSILYAAFFTLMASWWRWYKPPFYMAYSCAIAAGLYFWTTLLGERVRWRRWVPVVPAILGGIFVLAACVDQRKRFQAESALYQEVFRATQQVAAAILANSEPTQFVTLEPLGFIGFHAFERRFRDYPGLCAPEVVASLKRLGRKLPRQLDDHEALRALSQDIRPPIFVLRKFEYDANTAHATLRNYRQVGYVPITIRPPGQGGIEIAEAYYILRRTGDGNGE